MSCRRFVWGASVLGATFPTPPGAQWHDLSIVFRDGHTVVISLGDQRGTFTYKDLGMSKKNQTPDVQWKLLYHIAEEMGIFTWTSRHADENNKKRKQRLSAKLKAFFGIEGDPFNYRKDDGGWEAVFNLQIED